MHTHTDLDKHSTAGRSHCAANYIQDVFENIEVQQSKMLPIEYMTLCVCVCVITFYFLITQAGNIGV